MTNGQQVNGSGAGSQGTGSGGLPAAGGGAGVPAAGNGRINAVALPIIEKLKGRENYTTWAFAMKMTLIREGSWYTVSPAQGQAIDDEVSLRALATICLSLETTNYSLVQDAKDAKEAWDKLRNAFQDNGLTRRIGLLRKLTSIRLDECGSVESYVDELMSTAHKLVGIGFRVDDTWLAALLLMGLPENYEPMIMGLEASGTALTSDAVKAKILQDVKLPSGPKTSGGDGALYSNPKSRRRGGNNGPTKKDDTCHNCKKRGHFAAKCPQKQNSPRTAGKALCSVFAMGEVSDKEWYFDSGATCHMSRSGDGFVEQHRMAHPVATANNGSMMSVAKGLVKLDLSEGPIEVKEVLQIPELATNLLSISKICQKGLKVVFDADKCEVREHDGIVIASGTQSGGLYKLNRKHEQAMLTPSTGIWHRRLGHLNRQSLRKLMAMADGIELANDVIPECIACIEGKHARNPFPSSESRAEGLLDLVHSDLVGPIEVPSVGGSRYVMTFIDDASRKVFLYFLERKNEAFGAYENFKAMTERQTGRKLKVLRTDNGTEYVNKTFRTSMAKDGVRHEKTCPYTPEQNGVAERMNRTLIEKARSMLNDSRLPKEFWAEAVSTAAYLVNRSPTRSLQTTPEEAWTGKKPDLQHLRIFGSLALVHVPKQRRKKFDAKSQKAVFVGYADGTKGYRVYDPVKRSVQISRDVIVVQEGEPQNLVGISEEQQQIQFMELYTVDEPNASGGQHPVVEPSVGDDDVDEDDSEESAASDSGSSDLEFMDVLDSENEPALPSQLGRPAVEQQGLRRSDRERRTPGKYSDYVTYSSFSGEVVSPQSTPMCPKTSFDNPQSYEEALNGPDREKWIAAMREEIAALEENETWELTSLPSDRKAIRNKWVFKTKRGPTGDIERYKARLVVKGCSQRPGIDFDEVYSPVVRYSTIRYLLALAVKHDLDVEQMDAVTAFLQGELSDEVIYMELPRGFAGTSKQVCRLRKALYGLKQSSRVWNNQLDQALKKFGLEQSKVDPCLYFRIDGENMIFVTIYVDDFMIFTNNAKLKQKLKSFLHNCFKMKDLDEANFCLGLRITRDRKNGKLWVDQEHYVDSILQRFNMANCHPVSTPAEANVKLDKSMSPTTPEETREMKEVPYQEAVGCLTYLAQTTRPDISFAVNQVSQFNANPGRTHWNAVKRIMRYLRGTRSSRLTYSKERCADLVGYTDADWGGEPDSRKSTTGYVFTFMGGAVSWNVKRQPTVALSSCEAEYVALSRTVQEALWWHHFQSQIFGVRAIPIRCDNQSAICIARNQGYNPRTKHMDIKHHFVRDVLDQGVVELGYVNTKQQPADGFTKALVNQKLEENKKLIGFVA